MNTEGCARKNIDVQKLWYTTIEAQIETGRPFMLYKDAANGKDAEVAQRSSTLTEMQPSLTSRTLEPSNHPISAPRSSSTHPWRRWLSATSPLSSLALPSFINTKSGTYNFHKLHDVAKVVTFNLNQIMDVNYYPVPEACCSNMRHHPIGIGVQGLADTFMALHMLFNSPEAKALNIQIFETIYHAAAEVSTDMAETEGPYESWEGSPASQGKLQFNLWGVTPTDLWDWDKLKVRIQRVGMKNSLLCVPMLTASTSHILGFQLSSDYVTRQWRVDHIFLEYYEGYAPRILQGQINCPKWLFERPSQNASKGAMACREGARCVHGGQCACMGPRGMCWGSGHIGRAARCVVGLDMCLGGACCVGRH